MNNYLKIFLASLIVMGELTCLTLGYSLISMADAFINYVGAIIIIGASLLTYYCFYALFVKPIPEDITFGDLYNARKKEKESTTNQKPNP